MTTRDAIQYALAQSGFHTDIASTRSISATHEQQVIELALDDGTRLIAKATARDAGDRLHAEADGLGALREPGILFVPRVHALCDTDHHTVLLMDKLTPAPARIDEDAVWSRFGRELAQHHQSTPPATYGWSRDNYIGATPQPNTHTQDWVRFNTDHRLGHQLRLAEASRRLKQRDADTIARVIDRLPGLIPNHPAPALIHGDLWSGNAIMTLDPESHTPRVAVIDPAVSIGDAWADIAMMQLFGGFPKPCLDAYREANTDHDQLESRIGVYQLYHTLNHLNIFGEGYKHAALALANRLIA